MQQNGTHQTLYCQAEDCMHNEHGHCQANVIQISNAAQGTFCDTYVKQDAFVAGEIEAAGAFTAGIAGDAQFSGTADTEFGQDANDSPRIGCNVTQCAYNNALHCRAAGVNIGEPNDGVTCHCRTYRSK